MPKISIVMPVCNGEDYLQEAIDSIIAQTFTEWEFIIVNEYGSSAEATAILQEYAASEPRIRVIQNQARLRIAESLNVGLRAAKGEYIARMDADDISGRDRLKRQADYLDAHPEIDICGLKVDMFGEGVWDWKVYRQPEELRCGCLFYTPFVHPTVMMRAERLRQFHLEYDPRFIYTEDFDFFVRASQYLKYTNLEEKGLYRYRFSAQNATNIGGEKGIQFQKEVMARTFLQYGLEFSKQEIAILSPNSFPQARDTEDGLDKLELLDLLLKKVFLNDRLRKEFGTDALFAVLHRRWMDAYEKYRWQQPLMEDGRIRQAVARGLFHYGHFFKPKAARLAGHTPKVSIVLPTYNSEEYILDTLYSLLEQDFEDFELLAVNEYGSDDQTVKCISLFADPRIRILQNTERLGLAESLNRGIREAAGVYIARADADDVYPSHRLSKQVEFLDTHPDIAVCGSWQQHFGKRNYIHQPPTSPQEMKANLLFKCEVCHSTVMLRKKAFQDWNLWYDASYLSEDYELWARAAQNLKFATIPEVLGEYRWNGENITAKKMALLDREAQQIIARTLKGVLGIELPEEDWILLSGWENPFYGADADRLRQREEELLCRIEAENEKLAAYDRAALKNVLDQRRAWAGIQRREAVPAGYREQNAWIPKGEAPVGFFTLCKQGLKKLLKKLYRPFRRRYEERIISILETVWRQEGAIRNLQRTIDDSDGHLYDYYHTLCDRIEAQQQQILYLNHRIADAQSELFAQIAASEQNVMRSTGKQVQAAEQGLLKTIDCRVSNIEDQLRQTVDGRVWKAEENIRKIVDSRVWKAEENILQTVDGRVWKAEENILQTVDGRVWRAEENILQTVDGRVWRAEENILQTVDGRVWKAEENILQTVDGRIWKGERNLLNALQDRAVKRIPRTYLQRLTVHLVEHCNLNCQCCDNFSPIAAEEYTDINELEKDFVRLKELSKGNIKEIELSGGEALLHPHICAFMRMARNLFEKTDIQIVTNGILLPQMAEDFWQTCGELKITIVITKYPIDLDLERIRKKSEQYQVFWRYYDDCDVRETFFAPLDLEGKQDERKNFLACFHANACIYLRKGRMYTCSIAANIRHFNRYFGKSLPDAPANSISIYDAKSMEEIMSFLSNPIPLCCYCNIDRRKFGIPWGLSKREISEWVETVPQQAPAPMDGYASDYQ